MQRRRMVVIGLAGVLVLGSGGVARAMSDGVYDPRDQHCSPEAEDTANADEVEEGCHNAIVSLKNGDHEIVSAGTLQTPEGTFVHELSTDSDFDFTQVDPTKPIQVYFGADDNLSTGEHDGASGIGNGPSDGGGIRFLIDPATVQTWVDHGMAGDTDYLQHHPIPLASFGIGACADGICFTVTTERRVVYKGGAKGRSRHAADYQGVTWDPASCSGPSPTAADCDDPSTAKKETIKDWNNRVGTVYAEPGIQVFEDPDPEGSPLDPYPLPALYVGTCGVMAGGGDVVFPDSPITNSAGQLDLRTCG